MKSDKESYEIFREELMPFAVDLAKLVVRDGEGATNLVTVTVGVSIRVFMLFMLFMLGAHTYSSGYRLPHLSKLHYTEKTASTLCYIHI